MSNTPYQFLPLTKYELINILFATLIGLTGLFGIDMTLPSLPFIIEYFQTSVGTGQSSISLYVISMIITGLIYGPISDRIGRKPVILIGCSIACIGVLICISAPTISIFLIGRIVQGIGGGVGMSIGRTILNDVLDKYKLAVYGSYFSIILSAGLFLAPLIGGISQKYLEWQGAFAIMGLFFAMTFCIFSIFFKDTIPSIPPLKNSPSYVIAHFTTLLTSRIFLTYSICAGLATSTVMIYATTSSFFFQKTFLLSPINYGWIGSLICTSNIIGKILNSFFVKKTGVRYGIYIGMSIFTITGLTFLISSIMYSLNVLPIIIFIFITTLGQGFIFPNALSGALSNYRMMSGTASAIYGTIQYGIGFLSITIVSICSWHTPLTLAISYSIIGISGLLIISRHYLRSKPKSSNP